MTLPEPRYDREGIRLFCGDALAILPEIEAGSVDCVITDPPYGIGKASWDVEFPRTWIDGAWRAVKEDGLVVILTNGGDALKAGIETLGEFYRSTFAAWLCNGMTRGPISFGNWTAVIVGCRSGHWQPIQDVIRVTIDSRKKAKHPSPKPIDLMIQVLDRLTRPGDLILDPFAGSGSTLVACLKTGRRAIGIELDPAYCDIASRRLREAETPLFADMTG